MGIKLFISKINSIFSQVKIMHSSKTVINKQINKPQTPYETVTVAQAPGP